jgi:transcriptional regulator with XRE-family HTH domain
MQTYGEKIAQYRRANKLTQQELGAKLNVSAQAVSKWEKGQSEPDLITVRNLCRIFGISADRFLSDDKIEIFDAKNRRVTVVGVCTACLSVVEDESQVGEKTPHLLCRACLEKREEAAQREAELESARYRTERKEKLRARLRERNRGWATATVTAFLAFIALLLIYLFNPTKIWLIALTVSVPILLFTFLTQVFWGGPVRDFLKALLRIFLAPTVFYEMALESRMQVSVGRVILMAIGFIFTSVILLGGTVAAILFSFPLFFYTLVKIESDIRTLK